MSVTADMIAKINDLARRLNRIEKLDVNPPPSGYPVISGTPTAGKYAVWTAAGTIAASSFGTADLPRYSGTPTANALAYWTGAGTVAGDRSFYITSSGSVGIQTSAPTHLLQAGSAATDFHSSGAKIALNNDASGVEMSAATAHATQRSGFSLIRSRGDFTTPTTVADDDNLGFVAWKAYDGTNVLAPAVMEGQVDGSVSTGTVPVRVILATGRTGSRTTRQTWFNDGKVQVGDLTSIGASLLGVKAGSSSNDAAVGGVLYETTTQTGNITTGEDVLASYSIPANTLSANGMSIWFEAFGTMGNTTNSVTIRARFGTAGTSIIGSYTTTADSSAWSLRGRVIRTGAATQKGFAQHSALGARVSTTLNQTLSGAVTFEITGDATATNDIVLEALVIGYDDQNS